MQQKSFKIESGSDCYVSEPVGFHDAVILSVKQELSSVQIVFQLPQEHPDGSKFQLDCRGVHYCYYRADPKINITFGLWIFKNLKYQTVHLDLDSRALNEFKRVKEILEDISFEKNSSVKGLVLYAEPIAENELLVHCEEISGRFVK
jgi:hypothetical protein